MFCLGQHAVNDTGLCIMKTTVVGYAPPLPPPVVKPTPVVETKAPKSRSKKKAAKAG